MQRGLQSKLCVIGSSLGVDGRKAALAQGGAFIVNARLLVTDLLGDRLRPESIEGIFVNHAHDVGELSADAFVLRLFRVARLHLEDQLFSVHVVLVQDMQSAM